MWLPPASAARRRTWQHEDLRISASRGKSKRCYLLEADRLKGGGFRPGGLKLNGETGLPQWGDDYYSNLVMWTLPMALNGESVEQFELPKRMIKAAA